MGNCFLYGQKGGAKINGIIEEYLVKKDGAAISAGDFVTYLNEVVVSDGVAIATTSNIAAQGYLAAVQLTTDKVFCVYNTLSGSYYRTQSVVCTISGATITAGAAREIESNSSGTMQVKVFKITDTKVAIACDYRDADALGRNIRVWIATISGTTITRGGQTSSGGTYMYSTSATVFFSAVVLSETRMLVFHSAADKIYAFVLNISGTTPIVVTYNASFLDASSTLLVLQTELLSVNPFKILLYYREGSTRKILAFTITDLDTLTVTLGTAYVVNTTSTYSTSLMVVLNATTFLVISEDDPNDNIYSAACTINGITITLGTAQLLFKRAATGFGEIRAVKLNDDTLCIVYNTQNGSYAIYGVIVDIPTITVLKETLIIRDKKNPEITLFLDDAIFILASPFDSNIPYGYIYRFSPGIQKVEAYPEMPVHGVAKQNGNPGNIIEVYMPDGVIPLVINELTEFTSYASNTFSTTTSGTLTLPDKTKKYFVFLSGGRYSSGDVQYCGIYENGTLTQVYTNGTPATLAVTLNETTATINFRALSTTFSDSWGYVSYGYLLLN